MNAADLARFPLFAGADAAQREAIVERLAEERHPAESVLFSEGDPGDKLYLVTEGAVRISTVVSQGEEALAVMRPGSWFGEMSLIDDQPRSAFAIAQEDSVVMTLSRAEFTDLLQGDARLAIAVLSALARTLAVRLRETNDQVKAMHLLSMW